MHAEPVRQNKASRKAPDASITSAGRPLSTQVRTMLEPRFGWDFSRVRVHADHASAEFADSAHAHAVTIGEDIMFGAGAFEPGTTTGLRRLSHELAHVVQFSRSGTGPDAEGLAAAAAERVLGGGSIEPMALGSAPAALARDPHDGTARPSLGVDLRLSIAHFEGFPPGAATLTAQHRTRLTGTLMMMRSWLLREPMVRFPIIGRVGAGGQDAALASRRALAVAHELVAGGIPATALQFDTAPAGETGSQVDIAVPPGSRSADRAGSPTGGDAQFDLPPRLPVGPAGTPATAGLGGTPTSVPPNPWLPRPGIEPSAARPGTPGDILNATLSLPPVAQLRRLAEDRGEHLLRDLGRAGTTDWVAIGSGAAALTFVAGVGIAQSPALRDIVLDQINGLTIPLSLLADANFRIPVPRSRYQLNFDMRRLGPIPNDILRATSVRLNTRPLSGTPGPAGTLDPGVIFLIDLTKLPGLRGPLR